MITANTNFHHETADMKNRLGLQKRSGTNCLVFYMSNGKGRAKGEDFAGDWFAMTSPPQDWEAGTWHEVTCTADRAQGRAQLIIDGKVVVEASGDQFPDALADMFWVGSQNGHSWLRGDIDELIVSSTPSFRPFEPLPEERFRRPPIVPARPVTGKPVGEITGKTFSINLDFFDICIGTDTWDMRDCDREMERLMALCSHYGIDRVYFRVSVCGAVCYHTKVMTPADEAAFAKYPGELIDTCCASIPSERGRMAEVMRRIDPLARCAAYAHKHGMEVYAWVTLFDSMYYATETEFFQKHPEFTWVSRDGKKHIPGVPCYGYEEVRDYRLAQMRELLAYDIDGLMLSPRSHSPWPGRGKGGGNEGSRGYGFNGPVVAEYIRRYGTDPRDALPDSIEELRFVDVKADFLTQFLRSVKESTAVAGKRLVLVTSSSISDPIRAPWMVVDAETAVREQIVDELCVMGSVSSDLTRWKVLGDGAVACSTWASIHGRGYAECVSRMRSRFGTMLGNRTSDGSTFHELANLVYPDCWEETILEVLGDAAR